MDRQTDLQLVRKWLTFKQTNARCLYQYCPFQVLKLGFQKNNLNMRFERGVGGGPSFMDSL